MVEFPPFTPLTSHVTFEFVDPEIVVLNCCPLPSPRVTTEGSIVIVTLGGVELLPLPHPIEETATTMQRRERSAPGMKTLSQARRLKYQITREDLG
jgi:hypothetical protein